jgi:hypothetical protein
MNVRLNHEETIILLEAARVALNDGDTFDMIAEKMDVSDSTLADLRDKLETQMKTP